MHTGTIKQDRAYAQACRGAHTQTHDFPKMPSSEFIAEIVGVSVCSRVKITKAFPVFNFPTGQ